MYLQRRVNEQRLPHWELVDVTENFMLSIPFLMSRFIPLQIASDKLYSLYPPIMIRRV